MTHLIQPNGAGLVRAATPLVRATPEEIIAVNGTRTHYAPPPGSLEAKLYDAHGCFNASDLQKIQFPPVKWAVEGILPEGAAIIAGKPKMGKSYMMLNIAVAIATGGMAFSKVRCEEGDVLMGALEDPPCRLARRMTQIMGPSSAWPPRLTFCTRMERLDEGGFDFIQRWHDRARNPRLVCLDTFAHIRPRGSGRNSQYDDDYAALVPLQRFANERGVAIAVVHHFRKMPADDRIDEVSGTAGLTGVVDTVLTLRREPGRADATLYGRGRDLEGEIDLAFSYDQTRGLWTCLGPADSYRHSEERSEIIEVLKNSSEPMSPLEVAMALDRPEDADTIRKALQRLLGNDQLKKVGHGKYTHI